MTCAMIVEFVTWKNIRVVIGRRLLLTKNREKIATLDDLTTLKY